MPYIKFEKRDPRWVCVAKDCGFHTNDRLLWVHHHHVAKTLHCKKCDFWGDCHSQYYKHIQTKKHLKTDLVLSNK